MRKLTIIVLAVLMGCQSTQNTNETRKEYRIAYNVWYDQEKDDYEVFSMKPDGTDIINISNWEGVDWVYYAYQDKIYFISDRDTTHRMYFLYEMDAFGQNIRKVSDQRLNDSWLSSRNKGSELIVDPRVSGDSAFHIISSDGQLISKLYTNLAYYNDPYFSPDGTEVVFRGATQKFKKESGYLDELYIIGADGTGLRKLTTYPENDTLSAWYQYHAGPPFWEPDRNVITYNSVQNGYSSLFLTDPTGKTPERITPDSLYAAWHTWSSDGKWITFDGYPRPHEGDRDFDIYLMEYETGHIRQLTSDSTYQQGPVFVELIQE
ncbi:MAG: hypothetical protein RIC30_19520 [Marinoscillum sp.]